MASPGAPPVFAALTAPATPPSFDIVTSRLVESFKSKASGRLWFS